MLADFEIRRARLDEADRIAEAHRDSIRSIGPRFYEPEIIGDWTAHIRPELYVSAMERGEQFFIAVGDTPLVLGFSSHHVGGQIHGTAVYVRGSAARRGIGSALFRAAEAVAIAGGAAAIDIAASLAAVDFYKANGFDDVRRGVHRLPSGRAMACVFMRKVLTPSANHRGTELQKS